MLSILGGPFIFKSYFNLPGVIPLALTNEGSEVPGVLQLPSLFDGSGTKIGTCLFLFLVFRQSPAARAIHNPIAA